MTRVELAPKIQQDFDCILEHLIEHEVGIGTDRLIEIIEAIDVLQHNPHIGRRVAESFRELIIGRSSHAFSNPICEAIGKNVGA